MLDMSSMQDLFAQVKTAAGTIPNNEVEMAPGRMQTREDAPGRQATGLGHPWGEGVLSNDTAPQYSTSVDREAEDGRTKLLERVFEGVPGMVTTDKGLINELFEHFGDASTTSHSPLLQKKASHAPPPTLAEAVRRFR